MPSGIDMPTDAGQHITAINAAKLDFVARYYRSPTSHWPSLSASEARVLTSSGLRAVVVWEGASTQPGYFSRLSGVNDSTSAYHQATMVGQPSGSAIYFAVDFDTSANDINGPVNEYFRGIAAGFNAAGGDPPAYKVGVYGSGATCTSLSQAGLVDYIWLAMSTGWSGYRTCTNWNIKQGQALPNLAFGHDSDQARDDYGGFQVS